MDRRSKNKLSSLEISELFRSSMEGGFTVIGSFYGMQQFAKRNFISVIRNGNFVFLKIPSIGFYSFKKIRVSFSFKIFNGVIVLKEEMNIFFIIFKVYGILVTKIFFEEKFPLLFKFMTDWKSIQCICDIVLFGFQQQQIDELLRCLGRVTEVK